METMTKFCTNKVVVDETKIFVFVFVCFTIFILVLVFDDDCNSAN